MRPKQPGSCIGRLLKLGRKTIEIYDSCEVTALSLQMLSHYAIPSLPPSHLPQSSNTKLPSPRPLLSSNLFHGAVVEINALALYSRRAEKHTKLQVHYPRHSNEHLLPRVERHEMYTVLTFPETFRAKRGTFGGLLKGCISVQPSVFPSLLQWSCQIECTQESWYYDCQIK